MQVIPVQAIPNQTLQAQVGGQAATLNLYQLSYGLFMDVYLGASLVIAGVICLNATLIVRSAYLGFSGDFEFLDTENLTNPADPVYTGLGTRFQLAYLSADEIAALNLPVGVE